MKKNDLSVKRKRLIFQSNHRGCKEMDMVMGQFCAKHIETLSERDMAIYEQLLEEDDWDIWGWINHKGQPNDPAYEPILEQMREYTPLVEQQLQQ